MTDTNDQLSLMKKALQEIKSLRSALAEARAAKSEPIAIIGMGCRFPGGADDPDTYWRLLKNGVDAIAEVPRSRWDINAYYDADPDAPGKMYTRHGGFLDDIDQFDAQFFGVTPLDATNMDPQQRLLLEVAWEALENAGQVPGEVARTGVYVGLFMDDYLQLNFQSAGLNEIDAYNTLGLLRGLAAGRLSYVLNLHGPAMQLDTACSSSLLAAHLACQGLRNRECDLALAGGVNLILAPEVTIGLCRMKSMAADGRCKAFDARADGYVRGEGCGIAVLKRLADAMADGDPIYAVIRGTAVNHDGRSNGLTAPNGTAQKTVIREALADAGVEPGQIQFVEAHGTGTSLGDPIEAMALGEVLGQGRRDDDRLLVGTVKSNFGHLESAAGAAALIKVALSLQHGAIPASLHFHNPNPHIPWDRLPLTVPTRLAAWPGDRKRLAGVSSFGMTGTNVHMILEEAPAPSLHGPAVRAGDENQRAAILTLSASSDEALDGLARRYAVFLESNPDVSLRDVCYTAHNGRRHFEFRQAFVVDSVSSLIEKLKEAPRPSRRRAAGRKRPRIAFLFPGQGSRLRGVGKALYREAPAFRKAFDECSDILRPFTERPMSTLLFSGETVDSDRAENDGFDDRNLGGVTQTALFSVEYALASLWMSWGIVPDAVLGHSVGEYAAACVAGVFSLEDGLRLLAERERMMNALPRNGAMAAIFCREDLICEAIRPFGDDLSIAALNGSHAVISGRSDMVQIAVDRFRAEGVDARPLRVVHGFHSRLMDPMLDAFEQAASRTPLRPPGITFVSTVTGAAAATELVEPSYWRRHIRQPVRFADGFRTLHDLKCRIFVEAGSQPILIANASRVLEEMAEPSDVAMLPSLRSDRPDLQQMLESLGILYESGSDINWTSVQGEGRKVALPAYPFQRKRFWVEPRVRAPGSGDKPGTERLGRRLAMPFSQDAHFESWLSADSPRYLRDHELEGMIVVPAATYLSMALESIKELNLNEASSLRDVRFPKALTIPREASLRMRLVVSPASGERPAFRFATLRDDQAPFSDESWITHCSGTIEHGLASESGQCRLQDLKARHKENGDIARSAIEAGFAIGPSFRWTRAVSVGRREVLCRMGSPLPAGADGGFQIHPGLMDSCLRTLALCLPEEARNGQTIYVPFRIDALSLYERPKAGAALWCHAQASDAGDGQIAGTVRLMDDTGRMVMEVTGLEARRVALSSLVGLVKSGKGAVSLSDALVEIEWQRMPGGAASPAKGIDVPWLILDGESDLASDLATRLKMQGASVLVVSGSSSSIAEDDPWQRAVGELIAENSTNVLNVLCICIPPGDRQDIAMASPLLKDAQSCVGRNLLRLIHMLDESGATPRVWIVTRGAESVRRSDPVDPTHSWTSGLGKVAAMEYPRWRWTGIDLDPNTQPSNRRIVEEVRTLLMLSAEDGDEGLVAVRDGVCYVPRLVKKSVGAATEAGARLFVDSASYVVTGAFGALGTLVARWMVDQGAQHVVLAGRTASASNALVAELEQCGASVLVVNGDVADPASVARLFQAARASMPPIKGIMHVAGLLDDALLKNLTWDRFERVFGPKVHGTWNLHEQSLTLDLDFFVCFSSAASLIGSRGQGNYAAANAFMEALIHYRRQLGYPGLVVNWGTWADAGMAARMGDRDRDRMQAMGIDAIPAKAGLEVLGQLMRGDAVHAGVIPADWSKVVSSLFDVPPPMFANLVARRKDTREGLLTLLERTAPERRRKRLEERVRELIVSVMGNDAFPSADNDISFFELGIDSLMSLDLRNRLQADLDHTLPSTVAFEHPSVPDLVDYLIASVLPAGVFPPEPEERPDVHEEMAEPKVH